MIATRNTTPINGHNYTICLTQKEAEAIMKVMAQKFTNETMSQAQSNMALCVWSKLIDITQNKSNERYVNILRTKRGI